MRAAIEDIRKDINALARDVIQWVRDNSILSISVVSLVVALAISFMSLGYADGRNAAMQRCDIIQKTALDEQADETRKFSLMAMRLEIENRNLKSEITKLQSELSKTTGNLLHVEDKSDASASALAEMKTRIAELENQNTELERRVKKERDRGNFCWMARSRTKRTTTKK